MSYADFMTVELARKETTTTTTTMLPGGMEAAAATTQSTTVGNEKKIIVDEQKKQEIQRGRGQGDRMVKSSGVDGGDDDDELLPTGTGNPRDASLSGDGKYKFGIGAVGTGRYGVSGGGLTVISPQQKFGNLGAMGGGGNFGGGSGGSGGVGMKTAETATIGKVGSGFGNSENPNNNNNNNDKVNIRYGQRSKLTNETEKTATSPAKVVSPASVSAAAAESKSGLVMRSFKVADSVRGTVIQVQTPQRFWITTARESGFVRMPDAMWDYAKTKSGFEQLAEPSVGASCIILKDAADGNDYPLYCRAFIIAANKANETCDLWLVDYAESKKAVPNGKLLELPAAFALLPWQAIKCQLKGAEEFIVAFKSEPKLKAFADRINQQEVTATICGFDSANVAIVEVRVGEEKRDLLEICKQIAEGK